MSESSRRFRPLALLLTSLLIAVFALSAMGQTTTATIRGTVRDHAGDAVSGAEVNAVNRDTGFVHTVTTRSDGTFSMPGLIPGPYTFVVASPAFHSYQRDLTVLVGQTLTLDLSLSPSTVMAEAITVSGDVPVEMQTHEVTTNVTQQQIETLPQNNRNFMNFAALAPGVTVSDQEFNKTFQAGAQDANAVNVFIDGASFKNDVIQGGVVGQDSSRGNPFPQNAVQEFRVLTQNYSAEFQKSSSAIITAITKSGTNQISGKVFASYQDEDLVADDPITGANPAFERLQSGLSVGGPIILDRMHYFFSYEGNEQDRNELVQVGTPSVTPPAELVQRLRQYEGSFPSDFGLDLFFGKVSYQPNASNLIDVTGFIRDETDVRGFGGRTSFESAEEIVNDVSNFGVRHNFTSTSWFNEAAVGYQTFEWNPRPLNEQLVGHNYFDLLRIGGRDTEQTISQDRLMLRDDVTFAPMNLAGSHQVKFGVNVEEMDYEITKHFVGNPVFNYRSNENWEFPFEAFYGLGDPTITGDNTEIGFYLQDEWNPMDRLQINVGVRWDYESDMFPTDWVTPQDVVDKFSYFIDTERYFTDGNDRDAIDDMYAPRFGFSYDLTGTSSTVIFGGWGKYYDRILFNNSLDERFRGQYKVGQFLFSEEGGPLPDGRISAAWDDRYLTIAGLQELMELGITGRPEVFLIENDTQAPYSDQWTLGVRQEFAGIIGSLSYANTQSYNGFTFGWGHLNADNTCCRWGEVADRGYAAILASQDDKRTWYEAVYLSLDKPFSSDSRWGGGLAWTHSLKAEGQGGDLFSLDFPTVGDYPIRPLNNIQDDRIVANAIARLPLNFEVGTVVTYGSGLRYDIIDRSGGTGPAERILRGEGEGSSYLTIDLRLGYDFEIAGTAIGLVAEAFNITDDEIERDWNNVNTDANFGTPRSVVPGTQRRYQYGVQFTF